MKQFVMITTFVGVILVGGVCQAQGDQAKAAFDEGTELFKNGRFEAAAGAFREAYRLRPSWKIFFNIGQCHAAAKEYGEALEAFESYLSEGGDEVPSDKQTEVIAQVKTLRELVGYVEIDGEDGLVIIIDDNERGKTPLPGPIPTAAGVNHVLQITKAGETILKKTIRVGSTTSLKIPVNADKPSTATKETTPPPEEKKEAPLQTPQSPKKWTKPLMIAGITVGGIGLATMGAAIYTGLKAVSINSDLEAKTCVENSCNDDIYRMDNYQLSTNVLLAMGGTLTAAGVTMLIVSLVSKKKSKKAVAVIPSISPNAGGLWISTEF
jgi:uncharacterized glyoxalase superfamily protein PhnB